MKQETWEQMNSRHKQERFDMVQALADQRLTQTHAAHILGMTLGNLNNYICREKIHWPVKQQGLRTRWPAGSSGMESIKFRSMREAVQ